MSKSTFRKRLKEIMQLRGKRQADVALETGIPKSAISQYLSGKFEAKQDRIYVLSKYFNVSEAWLMGCDVPMERSFSEEINDRMNDYISKLPEYDLFDDSLYKGEVDGEHLSLIITRHEMEVIESYRKAEKPLRDGIDRMLGVEPLVTEEDAKKTV